ncbi:hypothetical protein Q8W71_24400 [Methylobacterium sp. NEAU 140]|uniref:hypothetical protein n=1 Tax=Methylobacterium sp. NEAU 140 TaxID=3064945 RepID=UPI0027374714|nr:hypothetical protein [Methylobacterium sp. NEAU 140]MDP4025777.1 hypothetical protein [Methylobacterium sp. NEAU 140]
MSLVSARLSRRVGPEHRSFVGLTGTVLGGTHAPCPNCRRGQLVAVPDALDRRRCDDPKCGAEYALAELGRTFALEGADVRELAVHERRQAVTLFVAAEIIGVLAAAWAVYARSWLTLVGALLLCLIICATAMVSRYRAWQLEHGRTFEARAPLGAFLAAEVDGLFRRGR